ncbi:galactinol synthase 1-like isoform X2 [Lycium ferocissimum]|uniref:galactinol synthase 1-like isoform X2 n=1 Tax=Lycium ferocissimum TaxID=112874 RepID=UPI0028168806|nr:galactinol synthase 1-like isoform X2 [Lycium ferocissimum]
MAPEIVSVSGQMVKPTILTNNNNASNTKAYVTFLAGNGDYVKGVVGLAKGLRKVQAAYPLVVAVLPDVPEEHRRILEAQGCIVREIEPVYPPENQTQFAMAYYVINYSKLRIWEFVEYEKMIYLDGEIQVYDNIDHLFDLPDGHFYAVMDCFCEKTWSHTPQYKIGYCQQCPDKVKWPNDNEELGQPPSLYFNAGMFVFEPDLDTYKDLLKTLKITPPTPFAEQGSKPWRYTGKEENMEREDIKMLVQKWWDIYNDGSLDYKKPVNQGADNSEPINLQPLIAAAMSEAGAAHYLTAPSAA